LGKRTFSRPYGLEWVLSAPARLKTGALIIIGGGRLIIAERVFFPF
jgi:hypothetical protein